MSSKPKAHISFISLKSKKEAQSAQKELYEQQTKIRQQKAYQVEMAKQAYKESITDFSKWFHFELPPSRPNEAYIANDGSKHSSLEMMLERNRIQNEREKKMCERKEKERKEWEEQQRRQRGEVNPLPHGPYLPDYTYVDEDGYVVYTSINPATNMMMLQDGSFRLV